MKKLIGLYSSAPGSGKSTVALMLQDHKTISFADPLKSLVSEVLSSLGHDGIELVYNQKEVGLPDIGVSPRHMMQTLGTEWGRACIHPGIWVMLAEAKAKKLLDDNKKVVFDDVRFPNEVEMIRRLGGEIWFVNRPGAIYDGEHSSEGALTEIVPDAFINNSGTYHQLSNAVKCFSV